MCYCPQNQYFFLASRSCFPWSSLCPSPLVLSLWVLVERVTPSSPSSTFGFQKSVLSSLPPWLTGESCACPYRVLSSVVSDTSQDTQRNSGYLWIVKENVGKLSFCKVNTIIHLEDARITAVSGRPYYPWHSWWMTHCPDKGWDL